MFGLFKKKNKPRKCQHYKSAGDSYPSNMEKVIYFTPYDKVKDGYAIAQCSNCGTRAYAGGRHAMHTGITDPIDDFIHYRINLKTLLAAFSKYSVKFEIHYKHFRSNKIAKEKA